MNVNRKIILKLNRQEIQSLLPILSTFNIERIESRNVRYMVAHLVGKFHIALASAVLESPKKQKFTLTAAQAAAFDEAFVQTPILVSDYNLGLYEELVIDRIIYEINSQL